MMTSSRARLMLAALCTTLALSSCATQPRDCGCVKPPAATPEPPAADQEGP